MVLGSLMYKTVIVGITELVSVVKMRFLIEKYSRKKNELSIFIFRPLV